MAKKSNGVQVLGSFVEPLAVRLTEVELLAFGQRLASTHADMDVHDQHQDAVKKDLKAKETALLAESSRLASIVRNKAEVRDVKVEAVANYERGCRVDIRQDTGEIIRERALLPHEAQGNLFPKEEAPQ